MTKGQVKILLAHLYLGIFFVMLYNGMVNRHHHVDGDGNIIVHAHPVADQDGDHEHSEEEFHLLDIISNPLHTFDASPELPTETSYQLLYEVTIFFTSKAFMPTGVDANALRGPPSFS